jgi:tRNA dimethylallyltransferase
MYNLVTVLGPTAVGKTSLSAKLAYEFSGEIISADSRQVYKGMDIGTGKDLDDYIVNGTSVPYHLIDIIKPTEEFNLFLFTSNFKEAFEDISARGKIPILAGGTGMYLSSVLQKYDLKKSDFDPIKFDHLNSNSENELRDMLISMKPSLHNTTDLLDKERLVRAIMIEKSAGGRVGSDLNVNSMVIGIYLHRETIKKQITERLKYRLNNGMIEEAERLLKEGVTPEKMRFFGLEYKFLAMYLSGELNYNDMFQKLNSAIHGFAKRQMTWFRKMEREGVKINWIEGSDINKARQFLLNNGFKQ